MVLLLMNSYKDFWEVSTTQEAFLKVIGASQEDKNDDMLDTSLLLDGISKRGKVLEIGAGYGRLMKLMAPHFSDVYGVDISSSLIEMSKGNLQSLNNCHSIIHTDGLTLPFKDDMFDFVYSIICFQHMPTIDIVRSNISEIARVLKTGGVCRIQTIKDLSVDRDDTPNGSGRNFSSGEEFLEEFKTVGLNGEVVVGLKHSQAIWLTAKK